MRSMLPPRSAIAPATAVSPAGHSGWPITVTSKRSGWREPTSTFPGWTSHCTPSSVAAALTAATACERASAEASSTDSNRPSTKCPRMTTCSISSTGKPDGARAPSRRVVTPGRSGPVMVTSSVSVIVALTLSRARGRGEAVARRGCQFGEYLRTLAVHRSRCGERKGALSNFADAKDLGGGMNCVAGGAIEVRG